MPSPLHEAPLQALREYPELLIHLLRELLDTPLPPGVRVLSQPSSFTEPAIEEYRADAVFVVESEASGQALVAVIVEVQRQPDEDKPYRWLRYAARVHDEYRCPTHLLVIATDETTARWAQRPIPGFLPGRAAAGNAPVVLSPRSLPQVASVEQAREKPGQAILAAILHAGVEGDIQGCYRTLRALHETAPSEAEALDRMWWLMGLLGGILTEERFTELQRQIMINPERKFIPRTEFERQPFYRGVAQGRAEGKAEGKAEGRAEGKAEGRAEGKAEGRAEGRAEGKVEALLRVLAARNFTLTPEQRQAVLSCQDQAQLERWLDAAVSAPSLAAVFDSR
jgi:hypothetical protein